MRQDLSDILQEIEELQKHRQPAALRQTALNKRASLWSALENLIASRNQFHEHHQRLGLTVLLLTTVLKDGDFDSETAERIRMEAMCNESTRFAIDSLRRAIHRERAIQVLSAPRQLIIACLIKYQFPVLQDMLVELLRIREETGAKVYFFLLS
jgi:hypothetical protein